MVSRKVTALITGASGGIGYELAKLFARDGHHCVLVARRREVLEKLASELRELGAGSTFVVPGDLSRRDTPQEIELQVNALGLQVDVLVNNAGFGVWGLFPETDLTQELEMLQLNILALTEMTKRFLGGMLERRFGHVLNVASTAAFQPGPYMAAYFASKAYVLHFTEAIANELQGSGVKVTALCPGPTHSSFAEAGGSDTAKMFLEKGLPTAAQVAAEGYQAMWRGQTVYIQGWRNRVLAWSSRLLPRSMVTAIVRAYKTSPARL